MRAKHQFSLGKTSVFSLPGMLKKRRSRRLQSQRGKGYEQVWMQVGKRWVSQRNGGGGGLVLSNENEM